VKSILCLIVVFTVVWPSLVLAEKNQLPQAANAALEKMNRDIEDAKREAVNTLKKLQKEEMKKGNLKSANLLQDKIDELSANPSLNILIGKWERKGYSICEFFGDGKASTGERVGFWSLENKKVVVTWDNGYVDTYDYPPINGVMNGVCKDGITGIIMTKLSTPAVKAKDSKL
jgi:hypothetical protein